MTFSALLLSLRRRRASAAAFLLIGLLPRLCLAQTTIHIPADAPTIQAGIDAAHDGDTVLVAPGTYLENVDFKGKAITVTSSDGPEKTIIDGRFLGATVTFKSGETQSSVLKSLTIRGGSEAPAGTFDFAPVGGVFVRGSSPIILQNVITENQCSGIDVADGGAPVIRSNVISNTTRSANANSSCAFINGSGIGLWGGGLQPIPIVGNTIENNKVGSDYDGAAVTANGSFPLLQNNIIRYNSTGADGGAFGMVNSNRLILTGNLIYGNSSYGSTIYVLPPESSQGPFTGILSNNTIVQNTSKAVTSFGDPVAQVWLEGNLAQWLVSNNIIVGTANQRAFTCGTGYRYLSLTPLVFDHNDIWNSDGTPTTGGVCSNPSGTYGNISADPLFVNSGTQDFHLTSASPAVDAGNNSVPDVLATTLEGTPRRSDATGKQYSTIDIGAYELQGTRPPDGTVLTLDPSVYELQAGTSLTLNAAIASTLGVPTGSLTYLMDEKPIGVAAIDAAGTSSFTTQALTPGAHAFTARYDGQGSFSPAVSVKFYVLVDKYGTNIVLSSTPNPSSLGQPVFFTISISSPGPGPLSPISLQLTSSSTVSLTPDVSGNATYQTSSLPVGVNYIRAWYDGDDQHFASSASIAQMVVDERQTTTMLTSSADPSLAGSPVTFTVKVTPLAGTPTGSVTLTDSASGFTATVPLAPDFTASVTTAALAVGGHTITATYSGDSTHLTSSATLLQEIISGYPTSVSLTSSLNPAAKGSTVTFRVAVTSQNGTPTGSITFADGSTPLVTASLSNGAASFSTATLSRGQHAITATYAGGGGFTGSSATVTEIITGVASTTSLSASATSVYALNPVTLRASVADAGSATVDPAALRIFDNGTPLAPLAIAADGSASIVASLSSGTHIITATYAGDAAADGSSSAPITVTVLPNITGTSLHFLNATATAFAPVNALALTVSSTAPTATPDGTVTFSSGATVLATGRLTPPGASSASLTLGAGTYAVVASYHPASPPANFLPSDSAPASLTISRADTNTALTGAVPPPTPQNRAITLTAAVGGVAGHPPTGTLSWIIDGQLALASPLDGNAAATFSSSTLAVGTHSVQPTYSGDVNYLPSAAGTFNITILARDFTLTPDPTLTVPAEHHRTIAVALASLGDFADDVHLACTDLPQFATCTFAANTVGLSAGASANTTVIIDTDQIGRFKGALAPGAGPGSGPGARPAVQADRRALPLAAALSPFTLLLLLLRRRRGRALPALTCSLLLLLSLVAATGLTGCGTRNPGFTPPGTYTFHIVATSSTITHTQPVTLVVTPE